MFLLAQNGCMIWREGLSTSWLIEQVGCVRRDLPLSCHRALNSRLKLAHPVVQVNAVVHIITFSVFVHLFPTVHV